MRVLLILTLLFCGLTQAQNTLSGSVKDTGGLPVPGANVKVVGEESANGHRHGRKLFHQLCYNAGYA